MIFNLLKEAEKTVGFDLRVFRLTIRVCGIVGVHDLSDFDENVMLIILVERVNCLLVHITDHVHRRKVHVLNGLHDVRKFALGRLEHPEHVVKVIAGDDGDVTALRLDWAEQGALSYDSECAFGADKQMLQISSSVILAQSGHIVEDCAICQHGSQTDAVRVQRVVADKLDTAGIGRQISADEAGTFGAEVERHLVAANFRVVLHIAKNAASLSAHNAVGLIETENAVHSRSADDNLVMDGHRSTDEASAATLRDNSQLALVAVAKNCAHIGCVGGLDHY